MIELIPFERAHLQRFSPQQAQQAEASIGEDMDVGDAWTALLHGEVLGCGGLIELWQGRAYAWALLAESAAPHLLRLTRGIRFRLAASSFARIEMVVDASFAPGARWAEMLGFERETPRPLRSYLPGGRDAWLYARFNDGGGNSNHAGGKGGSDL